MKLDWVQAKTYFDVNWAENDPGGERKANEKEQRAGQEAQQIGRSALQRE